MEDFPRRLFFFVPTNMTKRTIRLHPAFRDAIEYRKPRVSIAFLAEHANVPRLTFLRLAHGRSAQRAKLADHELPIAAQLVGYQGPLFSGDQP